MPSQPYPGDAWVIDFQRAVSARYAAHGQALDLENTVWVGRTLWDIGAGMPKEESAAKHLAELEAALGPVPPPPDLGPPPPNRMPPRLYRNPGVLEGRALCPMGTATPIVICGVSAFRACELMLHGRQGELEQYLDWCAGQRLNYGRVFLTARNMFDLHPQDGLNMLAHVLDLFGARGLYCEVVAIADTTDKDTGQPIRPGYDWAKHVAAAGAICARYSHTLLELCNEPAQPWQPYSPQQLAAMAAQVPAEVPVSLGASDGAQDESLAYIGTRSTYATVHGDRNPGEQGWRWVRHTKEQLSAVSEKVKLHTFDDERSRELTDPAKHFGVSGVERVCHLGGLFHSEGGQHCRIPDGLEAACFHQTRRAWDFVPVTFFGVFANTGWTAPLPESPVEGFTAINGDLDARCYATVHPTEAYVVALRTQSIQWRSGWRIVEHVDAGVPDAAFYHVVK